MNGTEADPIGQGGGVNTFLYGNCNPICLRDRSGLILEVFGDDSYTKNVYDQIDRIKNASPYFDHMIDELQNSPNWHIIEMPPNGDGDLTGTYIPGNVIDKIRGINGVGNGSNTWFDPCNWDLLKGKKTDPIFPLIHELQHALDIDRGSLNYSLNPQFGRPEMEIRAISVETGLANALKVPPPRIRLK